MLKHLSLLLLMATAISVLAQEQLVPLDKDLNGVAYPFEVKFHAFTSQGQELRMAYLDVVPNDANGKTVLLLHGKNFNAAYWGQTIAELGKHGYRVLAPDQIGFGKSSKPAHYQFSFQQLAANTKAILDSLQIGKVVVLGHSMGGMLAARFALSYPEQVDKLILENPIGLEDYQDLAPYQSIDANYQEELKNTVETYRNYQLAFYYDNKWKPAYDPWLNLLAGWTLHKDYPIVAWDAALTTDMIFTQPVVHEFDQIRCSTLLIIGTRDRTAIGKNRAPAAVQPTMGRYDLLGKKTQQAIPGSTLVELDNVGHLPHIEAFDRFMKPVLEFLGK